MVNVILDASENDDARLQATLRGNALPRGPGTGNTALPERYQNKCYIAQRPPHPHRCLLTVSLVFPLQEKIPCFLPARSTAPKFEAVRPRLVCSEETAVKAPGERRQVPATPRTLSCQRAEKHEYMRVSGAVDHDPSFLFISSECQFLMFTTLLNITPFRHGD